MTALRVYLFALAVDAVYELPALSPEAVYARFLAWADELLVARGGSGPRHAARESVEHLRFTGRARWRP